MKTNIKRTLKFVTLLVTSLLIATVSAQVYTQMFLQATVGVTGASLQWTDGSNTDVTADIAGSTCTITGLQGSPGLTAVYNDTVRITNVGSSTVTFNITTTQCEGSTANLTSIYIKIYNNTDESLLYTLTVWASGSMGDPIENVQIEAAETWKLSWEITWSNDAVTSDSVNVAVRLDVS